MVVLSMAGVAVRPSFGLREAESQLALASERVAQRESIRTELARFEQAGGQARVRAAFQMLAARVPPPAPDLELHGLLRLLAERQGALLTGLSLGTPRDAGFARLRDVVAVREVRLEGESTLDALLEMLGALRALDRPFSILEFQWTRGETRGPTHWTMTLGFFESRPHDAFPDEGDAVFPESP